MSAAAIPTADHRFNGGPKATLVKLLGSEQAAAKFKVGTDYDLTGMNPRCRADVLAAGLFTPLPIGTPAEQAAKAQERERQAQAAKAKADRERPARLKAAVEGVTKEQSQYRDLLAAVARVIPPAAVVQAVNAVVLDARAVVEAEEVIYEQELRAHHTATSAMPRPPAAPDPHPALVAARARLDGLTAVQRQLEDGRKAVRLAENNVAAIKAEAE